VNYSKRRHWIRLSTFFYLFILFGSKAYALPEELKDGLVKFEVERGNYLSALTILDESDADKLPVSFAAAWHGFALDHTRTRAVLESVISRGKDLEPTERFRIGRVYYELGECIEALKAFKPLKNKLPLSLKQEWAFYRANCFIQLGSNKRAAQALSEILDGAWVANAYYNLAVAYADTSIDKTKALVALRVATELNKSSDRYERELADRVYYAAGAIYLNEGKPELAEKFFNKIHLESDSAPQALYMHGVTKLEQKDFRAATQSWFSAKKYATIHPGVSESMLAIPYAYEGAGYTSQALEAYLEASKVFQQELLNIEQMIRSIKKYGVRKVLVEQEQLDGLEWFLAKDIAKNTKRAAYYGFLIRTPALYDLVANLMELKRLDEKLELWENQLDVYQGAISKKRKGFKRSAASLSLKEVQGKIAVLNKRAGSKALSQAEPVDKQDISAAIAELEGRLESTSHKVSSGAEKLSQQSGSVAALRKRTTQQREALQKLIQRYDAYVTDAALERFSELSAVMKSNQEKAEQGLVHILESVAELNTAPLVPAVEERR